MPGRGLRPVWFALPAALAVAAALRLFDPRVSGLWWNTALLAAGACLIGLPLGILAAALVSKTDVPGRRLAFSLLAAMLPVPLFLVAGAWDAGFGQQGWQTLALNPHLTRSPWLSGWRAAIWIHGVAAVPWVALIVAAGLRTAEADLEEEASLAASPARVLWHVTLPRARGAISVAALWIAVVAAAEISVTDFFQVRTFAEEVYTQAALGTFDVGAGGWGLAPASLRLGAGANSTAGGEVTIANPHSRFSAIGLCLGLGLVVVLSSVALFAARGLIVDLAGVAVRRHWVWRLQGSSRWFASMLLGLILFAVAGLPLVNLLYKSGALVTVTEAARTRSWSAAKVLERLAAAPGEFAGDLWLTLQVSSAAATAALVLGMPLAWSLRLARRPPVLRLVALAACLAIPGPLLGIGVIRLLNQPPSSALAFLAALYDSQFAPWLVQMIRALPLVTLVLWFALASIPQSVLDAAVVDGAGWWNRLLRIALPQRWPAAFAAWLVGLAVAAGELAATVLVVPPGRSTAITVRIFQLLHYGVDDRVAAISLVLALAMGLIAALTIFTLRGSRIPTAVDS
jgi:iron(III) transport system permease protein